MRTLRPLVGLVTLACLAPPAEAQGSPCHDLGAVTAVAQDAMSQLGLLQGIAIQIDQHGQNLYRQAFGTYTVNETVAIASATKTLSAAVLMSLVDQNLVQLDDRVSQYLPEYATPALNGITLRMCFTHTAGFATGSPWISDDNVTLRQAAQNLALEPLAYLPGTAFSYGGVSMHVAGAVCEVASGRPWSQLFAQRIAQPLGFTGTDYFAFGLTANPRIAGGARSNLHDYGRFVDMLRAGGTWNNTTVLSQASVDEILRDQTSHLPVLNTPHPYGAPYGIGIWLDRRDAAGRTTFASGVGAFGFAGFVDRAHDSSGVFLVRHLNQITYPFFERVIDATDAALLPAGVSCFGTGSPPCAADTWINATTWPRVGLPDFALRADRAPANGFGVAALDFALRPAGVTLLDLTFWLPVPVAFAGAWVADPTGHAMLAMPLTGVATGQGFAVQSAWLDPGGCGAHGARASHALIFSVVP